MAETYREAYMAMMFGMRGDSRMTDAATNGLSNCALAYDILRAIGSMSRMETGEKTYFVTSAAGIEWFYDDGNGEALRNALNWAHDIHESNNPACFEVVRHGRGYRIETLYAR